MADQATQVTVAGLIAGFGSTVVIFRLQREVELQGEGQPTWIPWADYLVLAATSLALILGVFPVVSGLVPGSVAVALGMASNTGAVVLLFGYVFAILAHYRLLFGQRRTGSKGRTNPEPAEGWIVWLTALTAALLFGIVVCRSLLLCVVDRIQGVVCGGGS